MKRDTILTKPITSSFLSCEKDAEIILKKLFINSRPYSDILKSLLVINTKDCLENINKDSYQEILKNISLSDLFEQEYISLAPKIRLYEHENVKAYLRISFDNFIPNAENPEFRDCIVNFDIICHTDYWDLMDYQLRPLKIAGYIDGLLDGAKLTGIGTFQFMGCSELVLDENFSGYTLMFAAIHGTDDQIPAEEA